MTFATGSLEQAEELRKMHRHKEAAPFYEDALKSAVTDDERRRVYHMGGVNYRMAGDHVGALEWLRNAAKLAKTANQRGHILRDIAEAHSRLGHYLEALACISSSSGEFGDNFKENEDELAANLGYLARIKLRMGETESALALFSTANEQLESGSNRHYELYNKLHFARTFILRGQSDEAEGLLDDAETLIEMHPGVGFERHREKIHFMLEHLTDPDAVRDYSAT